MSTLLSAPRGLVGLRLLFDGVAEVITLFAHVSESLVGFGASISLHFAHFAFKLRLVVSQQIDVWLRS
jgi:hypothetical protein